MSYPERLGIQALEPSVGDLLRLKSFLDGMDRLSEADVRKACRLLTEQALVSQPAMIRWLAGKRPPIWGRGSRPQVAA
jgi:hypothetical protein